MSSVALLAISIGDGYGQRTLWLDR
jgi:hypothetical protein